MNPITELMLAAVAAVAAGRVALADSNPRRATVGRGVEVYDWTVDGRPASRRLRPVLDDLAAAELISYDPGPTVLTDAGRAALGADNPEEKASA